MPGFDPEKPSIARVYDYLLGGKDHFAADREMGDRLLAVFPPVADLAPENRQFLARAVTWAANQGVGQFIDLGCGMPTAPNTHETAKAVTPDARVAYVDDRWFRTYSTGVTQGHNFSVADFTALFDGMELVPPGVAEARQWHPGWADPPGGPPRDGQAIAGVARLTDGART